MPVLVTGGAGYIGSHTVKHFLEKNEDVVIVDSLLIGYEEELQTNKFYKCDIRDKESLDKVFKETNPTNIYGETKLAMGKMMKWFDKAYNTKYVDLRYFNVAGVYVDVSIGEDHKT